MFRRVLNNFRGHTDDKTSAPETNTGNPHSSISIEDQATSLNENSTDNTNSAATATPETDASTEKSSETNASPNPLSDEQKRKEDKNVVLRGIMRMAVFILIFSSHFYYWFKFSLRGRGWIAAIVSLLTAAAWTLACAGSKFFRCCLLVYIPSSASGYGLVLWDFFSSWLIVRSSVEGILENQNILIGNDSIKGNMSGGPMLLDELSEDYSFFNAIMIVFPYLELLITGFYVGSMVLEKKVNPADLNTKTEKTEENVFKKFGGRVNKKAIDHILGGLSVGIAVIFYIEHITAKMVQYYYPGADFCEPSTGWLIVYGFKILVIFALRAFEDDFLEFKELICVYMLCMDKTVETPAVPLLADDTKNAAAKSLANVSNLLTVQNNSKPVGGNPSSQTKKAFSILDI